MITKYLRNYKFNSILIRNFLIIVLLFVVPSALLGMVYNSYSRQIMVGEISESNMNSLYRSSDTIENVMMQLYSFAYNLSVNNDTMLFSFMSAEELKSTNFAANLYKNIKYYTMTYDYVDTVYIYSEATGLVVIGGEIVPLENVADISWFDMYTEMDGRSFVMQSRRKNDYYPYYITLICPIYSGSLKSQGAVVVNINIEELGRLIGSNGNVTQEFYILDDSMRLYFSSDYRIAGNHDYAPEALYFLKERDVDFSEIRALNGCETMVSFVHSRKYNWNYLLLNPLSVYESKMEQLRTFQFQMIGLSLVLSIIVSFYVSFKSFEPVRSIMNAVENPDTTIGTYIAEEQHENEVSYITGLVRKKHEQNSQLKLEIEERIEKLNDAQMVALQSQIDPHFLYNTLDIINWMAIEKLNGENEVSDMISSLAQLLRLSLQRTSYLVTVKEEVEHTKLYVRILEHRYKDKLKVHWNISDEILSCKIVKLSIQPLVENAINHGLRAKRYQGNIHINGAMIQNNIVISVEDDGEGMSEEEQSELNLHLKTDYEFGVKHVGIRNVNQRTKLLFGERYGVIVGDRESSGGLAVTIVYPCNA